MNDDDFIPTRRSLLNRIKNWEDQESWKQFFDTYGRLIYSVAVKAGLTDAEAQDVVQETILIVAKKIPEFKYDPAVGSFKSWLRLITRRRIEKQLKKRMPSKAEQTSNWSRAAAAATPPPTWRHQHCAHCAPPTPATDPPLRPRTGCARC